MSNFGIVFGGVSGSGKKTLAEMEPNNGNKTVGENKIEKASVILTAPLDVLVKRSNMSPRELYYNNERMLDTASFHGIMLSDTGSKSPVRNYWEVKRGGPARAIPLKDMDAEYVEKTFSKITDDIYLDPYTPNHSYVVKVHDKIWEWAINVLRKNMIKTAHISINSNGIMYCRTMENATPLVLTVSEYVDDTEYTGYTDRYTDVVGRYQNGPIVTFGWGTDGTIDRRLIDDIVVNDLVAMETEAIKVYESLRYNLKPGSVIKKLMLWFSEESTGLCCYDMDIGGMTGCVDRPFDAECPFEYQHQIDVYVSDKYTKFTHGDLYKKIK
jgi:hypothetical protein